MRQEEALVPAESGLGHPRPWVYKNVAIAQNTKAFDLRFILNMAILLK